MSSIRTGTAISAAAVGVGARRSATKSIRVMSVSWPTAEISGMRLSAAARTTISSLKAHRSSIRAAAAGRDDEVGPRDIERDAIADRVEAADRRRDLLGRAVALHTHRPDQHMAREAVGQAVEDVADDGPGRRGDDADHRGEERKEMLPRLVEQAFGGELLLALLEERHQRPEACRLQRLDDDLVGRAARIGGQPPGGDDLKPSSGLMRMRGEGASPHHRIDLRAVVLESEIGVAPRNAGRDSRRFRRAPAPGRGRPRPCGGARPRARSPSIPEY